MARSECGNNVRKQLAQHALVSKSLDLHRGAWCCSSRNQARQDDGRVYVLCLWSEDSAWTIYGDASTEAFGLSAEEMKSKLAAKVRSAGA